MKIFIVISNATWTLTYLNSPESGVSMTIGSAVPSLWVTVTLTPASLGLILPVMKIPLLPTNFTASPGQVSTNYKCHSCRSTVYSPQGNVKVFYTTKLVYILSWESTIYEIIKTAKSLDQIYKMGLKNQMKLSWYLLNWTLYFHT